MLPSPSWIIVRRVISLDSFLILPMLAPAPVRITDLELGAHHDRRLVLADHHPAALLRYLGP